MKINVSLITASFFVNAVINCHAAIPASWTVETDRIQERVVEAFHGEELALEAVLNSRGKPLEIAGKTANLYWQTNGMDRLYWTTNAVIGTGADGATNVIRAVFASAMDPGASTVRGFLGIAGENYRANFIIRFRNSPGAVPNELQMPVATLDFSKVRTVNAPWIEETTADARYATRDELEAEITKSGAMRTLPKYLHLYESGDSYPEAAQEYYRTRGDGKVDGGCSAVRDGGFLYRNFDYPFDNRAEFVVKMAAGEGRFASVGVATVGTNLTEQMVTSGNPEYSERYKWLPGATVDGINENGVVAEINVVDGDPQTSGWHTGGDIHPLAAVRWALDNATNAEHAATYLAENIKFPAGWMQNFHYMIADERETWIVENGGAHKVGEPAVMTNFSLYPDYDDGMGWERFRLLALGANITNVWYTNAYRRETNPPWVSDLAEVISYTNAIFDAWAAHPKEYFRNQLNGGQPWWQSVHTSVYDITNRVLRIAVQETDDWYVFALPSGGKVQSVNGKTGTVTIAASDVGAYSKQQSNEKFVPVYNGEAETEFNGEIVANDSEYGKAGFGPYGLYTEGSEDEERGIYEGGQIMHNDKPVVYGISTNGTTLHGTVNLTPIAEDSRLALSYSRGIYQYMTGNTNAWFEGTNYNVNAEQAASKVKYQPEPWEDVLFTPCSLQLYEIRDGERRCVWDQRDWTVYYWNFKSAQLSNAMANATHDLGESVRTNYMRRGWANYTAVNGLDNPNPSTLFVDTEKVSLMAGMQWEKMIELGGHSYYTITANGITISTNDAQSTFLSIKDFEGNACLTFRKTSSYLVWINNEIQSRHYDYQGRVCFTINTDICPTAEFSTILEDDSFIEAGEDGCPANHEWTGSAGAWTSHFLLKPGITASACFARYKVMREGENIVEYSVPVRLNGGISFEQDGVTKKIRPRVSGTTVTWEVVQ